MPTGYTVCVEKGASFREFALRCARGMGACLTLRDEPLDKPLPTKIVPSDYHARGIVEAEKDLAELKSMTDEAVSLKCRYEYDKALLDKEEGVRENLALRNKYMAMKAAVNEWIPPSKEHLGLKTLMLEQLRTSMEFDCSNYCANQVIRLKTVQEWRTARMDEILRNLGYHGIENQKAIDRASGATTWLRRLVASLPEEASDEVLKEREVRGE